MEPPTVIMLRELAVTPTCVAAPTLAKKLGWKLGRVYRALRAAESQEWAVPMRPGCYRATDKGKAVAAAAVAVAEAEEKGLRASRWVKHAEGRRKGLRPRLWRTLRMLGKATIGEIVTQAANTAEQDRLKGVHAQAYGYIAALVKAGYVVKFPGRGGPCTYLLLPDKNTGPLAPILSKRGLFDPNCDKLVFAGQVRT